MTRARVLVTGGSGFIGTNLVQHLLDLGTVDLCSLDIAAPRVPAHRAVWTRVDLLHPAALREVITTFRPSAICHLAARTDLEGACVDEYPANSAGVANVIAAARATASVERVLFASTQLVCTPGRLPADDFDYSPPNAYGESKVVGERLVRSRAGDAFTWILLRPTSIWGPWAPARDRAFFTSVRRGVYVHPRGVPVRKSFGYVGNAVWQIARLLEAPPGDVHGRVLYLADYEAYDILHWAELIRTEFGARPIRQVPPAVLRALASAGDVLKRLGVREPPLTSYRLRNLMTETVFPMEPLRTLCGEPPFDLPAATHRAVAWIRAHPDH